MQVRQMTDVNSRGTNQLAIKAAELRAAGKLTEAIEVYRRLTAEYPEPQAFSELSLVLSATGRNDEALAAIDEAIARYPNNLRLIAQRGVILERLRRYGEAIQIYERVLARDPALAPVMNNLAGLLNHQGRHEDAIKLFRRSLSIRPNATVHSNLLFVMNYSGLYDQCELLAEHKHWASLYAALPNLTRFFNTRDPERRLRVGYLSPDFRMHPVAFFIGAIIANHDKNTFEIFCYSSNFTMDEMTTTLRRMNVCWREIAALDDAKAAQLIRNDRIDILIDLAGHTAGGRLLALAQLPAPIQASYLGYPNTTGMQAIGYRFTDAWVDPHGLSDAAHTEKLIRLPGCFVAYTPPANMPAVRELPARVNGYITFGSFNNPAKISSDSVSLWSQVLDAVPNARLLIKAHYFADAATSDRFRQLFAAQGISADRLIIVSEPRGSIDHYDTYNRVDIALDTVPYNGTTTTCEALWMGVPVVVLAGTRHASRVGVSLLNAARLSFLIAPTMEVFVGTACALANDLDNLAALRSSLRSRLRVSPLLDTIGLTRNLEASYRMLWRNWCQLQN
jgi:predicted O-linked N-acetylglucosamine transferase (SPINDLY family)